MHSYVVMHDRQSGPYFINERYTLTDWHRSSVLDTLMIYVRRSATLQGSLQGEICMIRFSRHRRTIEFFMVSCSWAIITLPTAFLRYIFLLLASFHVRLQMFIFKAHLHSHVATLCNCKIIGTFNRVPNKCTNV